MFTITPKNNLDINLQQPKELIGKELWENLEFFEPLELTKEIQSIIIESDDAETLQFPWELLYHPTYGFLAQHPNFTLSRKIPNLPNGSSPLEKRPLRVLFFSTLPDDIGEQGRLSVEKEQEVVLETLLPFRQKGLVEISIPNDGRFSSLKKLIEKEKPDMVFLSGHSSYTDGKGSFLFEDKRGLGVHIDEKELNTAFVGSSVECVVLSSCESAMASNETLKSGLVMSLAFSGIKNVIGMRESVYDKAGIIFAQNFIEQVANEKSIAQAVQKARHEIGKLEDEVKEHWHLPMLVSQDVYRPLVNWDFVPTPPTQESLNQTLNQILYPTLYVGRRREFRTFYNYLYENKLKKLLLYGEGGIGKTAMVAKFGVELRKEEYKVFDYSLKHGGDFDDFLLDIELELSEANSKKFMLIKERCSDETCIVKRLTKLLLEEHTKVAFIFDNLESVQDPITKEITDTKLKAWIETLSNMDNVVVLLTSRWLLPNCEHAIVLNRPLKSDFLYFVSMQNIKVSRKDKLNKIYETFGGNYRGVGFFIKAIENMNGLDEEQFLAKLSTATREIQIDMSIEQILSYLSLKEGELLERMTVYDVPIPKEGVRKIALDLPKEALQRLVSFSLVEESYNAIYEENEYQISALVYAFIKDRFVLSKEVKVLASSFLFYIFNDERRTLEQALITYRAFILAERQKEADILALYWIVDKLNKLGKYKTIIEDFLPPILNSPDRDIQSEAFSEMGKQYHFLSDYKQALFFYEKALILKKGLNKNAEGSVLNGISQVYQLTSEYDKALKYLEESLRLSEDKGSKGVILGNIAKVYISKSEYSRALLYLNESLEIKIKSKNRFGEATTLNNIATVYMCLQEYDKALVYIEKAMTGHLTKESEGTAWHNKGNIMYEKGKVMSALNCLKKALEIRIEIEDKLGEGKTLNSIAVIYMHTEEYIEAFKYFDKSYWIQTEIMDRSGLSTTTFNMGYCYRYMNKLHEAIELWVTSYNIAIEINEIETLSKLERLSKELGFDNGLLCWKDFKIRLES